jgi:group I intron endonuclease
MITINYDYVSFDNLLDFEKYSPAVYQWRNILDGKIYLGSSEHPIRRKSEHRYLLSINEHHSPYFQNAWNAYTEEFFVYERIEIVDIAGLNEKEITKALLACEQKWLDLLKPYLRDAGYNVATVAGSRRGVKASDETRALQSSQRKDVPKTLSHAANISEALKISPIAIAQRERLFESLRDVPKTESHRKNLSISKTGHKQSAETIEKRVSQLRDKPLSSSHKQAISEGNSGKIRTEEQRQNMRDGRAKKKEERRLNTLFQQIYDDEQIMLVDLIG